MQANPILTKVFDIFPEPLKSKVGERTYEFVMGTRAAIMGAEYHEVHLEGDRVIKYYEIDKGRDETILFLHGFADSKETFFDAAAHLSDDYNIICPDLPGFGKSFKRRNDKYSIDNYAFWLRDFMEEINLNRCHIAGNSLGGAIALRLAILTPQKFRTLTLVDPAGVFIPEPYSLHHELFDGHIIFEVHNKDEFEYFLRRVFNKKPFMPYPVNEFIYKEFSKHSTWHRKVLGDLLNGVKSVNDPNLDQMALNKYLKDLQLPTFLIWGEDDSFFPKETALCMYQDIEDCQIHFLSDIGHCPQIENPKLFAKTFKKYLHQQIIRLSIRDKQMQYDDVYEDGQVKRVPAKLDGTSSRERAKSVRASKGKAKRATKSSKKKPAKKKTAKKAVSPNKTTAKKPRLKPKKNSA